MRITFPKGLAAVALILALAALGACADSPLTPGARGVNGGLQNVDVGVEAGSLELRATYDGQSLGGMNLTSCSIYARVRHTGNNSVAQTWFCYPTTIANLSPGEYEVKALFGANQNTPAAEPQTVNVTAATTTTVTLAADGNVGLLTGNVTLNGQPGNNLVVCARTGYTGENGDQWAPGAMDQCGYIYGQAPYNGSFRFLVPAGSGTLLVRGSTGNQLHAVPFTTTAGETSSAGTIAVSLGDLKITPTYDGQQLHTLSLTSCSIYARPQHATLGTAAQGWFCSPHTFPNLTTGEYDVALSFGANMRTPVADTQRVEVTAGATTAMSAATEGRTGLLSGAVTLNGQPGNNLVVCARSGYTGANNDQWTPDAMDQCGYIYSYAPNNGAFRFLAPAGSGTIVVRGASGNELARLPYTIAAGQELDAGTIAVELGDLSLSATYKGDALQALNLTSCSIYARATSTANNTTAQTWFCGETTIQNLSPGSYTVNALFGANMNTPAAEGQTATVSAGSATPVAFETESTVGMVTGTVTLNGQPGHNLVVCVQTGYTGPNNDQWTPSAMQQCGYIWSQAPYNGGFRFLVPNGCGNGTVKGPSGNLLGSFSFCTEAGEETDVGNPVEPEDDTAPIVTPTITGTEGSNGWYTSDVSVTWTVVDEESDITTPACAAGSVTSNTTGTTFECTATSAGGTATETVTIKRDATVPTIAYAGNAGTYTVDQTVAITCSASDDMSGVASSSCAPVSGAAYGFTLGANSVSATATDNAGNSSSASATFTVTVTHASLCTLVQRWVSQGGVANSLCVKLRNAERGVGGGDALRPFVNEVQAQSGKHVPADKAALLIELARAI